jgi:hypothetical protein
MLHPAEGRAQSACARRTSKAKARSAILSSGETVHAFQSSNVTLNLRPLMRPELKLCWAARLMLLFTATYEK